MYLQNEFGRIYYQVHGPGDGPCIIFSHGVSMDNETFGAQVHALRDRYRVVTWHGKSSPIDDRLPFSETSARIIRDILDHLGVERAVLAGLSLGSYVTQIAAHMYPHRVRATVHIGGGPLHPPVTSAARLMGPLVGLFIGLYPKRSIFRAFAAHRARKPETRAYLEEISSANGKRVMAHATRELLKDMTRGLPAHTGEPKLLCHGEYEIPFVVRQMTRWHEEAPGSRFAVIPDAHHVANQDNPQGTNCLISGFLEELTAGSGGGW